MSSTIGKRDKIKVETGKFKIRPRISALISSVRNNDSLANIEETWISIFSEQAVNIDELLDTILTEIEKQSTGLSLEETKKLIIETYVRILACLEFPNTEELKSDINEFHSIFLKFSKYIVNEIATTNTIDANTFIANSISEIFQLIGNISKQNASITQTVNKIVNSIPSILEA